MLEEQPQNSSHEETSALDEKIARRLAAAQLLFFDLVGGLPELHSRDAATKAPRETCVQHVEVQVVLDVGVVVDAHVKAVKRRLRKQAHGEQIGRASCRERV